jgi:hypothetical protein
MLIDQIQLASEYFNGIGRSRQFVAGIRTTNTWFEAVIAGSIARGSLLGAAVLRLCGSDPKIQVIGLKGDQ